MNESKLLSIGKILSFHGIKGELKVGYTQGKESQLKNIKEIFAVKEENPSYLIKLTIEQLRFHKNFAIIKFKEINSVDEVLEVKGAFLKAKKSELEKYLEEGEFYVDDLVGMDVFDIEGNDIGEVKGIIDIKEENLLEISDKNNKKYLIPFVKDLVPEVDIKNRKVVIKSIPGLIENGTLTNEV